MRMQEQILGLLEEAGFPTETNDKIMMMVMEAEKAKYGDPHEITEA
jgi:hypothetical protein